ncbi:hypothetical protein [uncultured Hyphomonas sp.]|uniref:hypothetical protein n=1 Tax=uncultured Hyphomonas sp. TaxID=225298 RepID=UPI002AAB0A24|nr:hypothetical protein [uncultured Hyphomonas sp.]
MKLLHVLVGVCCLLAAGCRLSLPNDPFVESALYKPSRENAALWLSELSDREDEIHKIFDNLTIAENGWYKVYDPSDGKTRFFKFVRESDGTPPLLVEHNGQDGYSVNVYAFKNYQNSGMTICSQWLTSKSSAEDIAQAAETAGFSVRNDSYYWFARSSVSLVQVRKFFREMESRDGWSCI